MLGGFMGKIFVPRVVWMAPKRCSLVQDCYTLQLLLELNCQILVVV